MCVNVSVRLFDDWSDVKFTMNCDYIINDIENSQFICFIYVKR